MSLFQLRRTYRSLGGRDDTYCDFESIEAETLDAAIEAAKATLRDPSSSALSVAVLTVPGGSMVWMMRATDDA